MKDLSMDDAEIVARCLSGETEAFEMIVKKYQSGLLSLAWQILQNREEARDVAQDVFVQTYERLSHFDRTRSFKNWLYSIAYKRCLDRKRMEKSHLRLLKRFSGETSLFNSEKKTEKSLEEAEEWSSLLPLLQEKERAIVWLKFGEGYTSPEIGRILRCSENTVRAYLFNAKKKVKRWLEAKKNV